ncbi:MAG: DUF1194 domain-containing protein [Shimia sp.]
MVKALALLAALWAGGAEAACRQALALGLDVSASVDAREYRLQLDGIALALAAPEVRAKLLAQPEAPVSLLVYEWSGPGNHRVVVPWTPIPDDAALGAVQAVLRAAQRLEPLTTRAQSTAIGPALAFGLAQLETKSRCWKRTLDLSGDGKHNTGGDPRTLRPAFTRAGITVNGLVIGVDSPRGGDIREVEIGELSSYYHAHVLTGPDAFLETALGFDDFERAMRRKLERELEGIVLGALQ